MLGSRDAENAPSWGCAGHIATEQCDPLASWSTLRRLPFELFSFGGAVSFPAGQMDAWLPFSWRLLAASPPQRFQRGRQVLQKLLARALQSWRVRLAAMNADDLLDPNGHIICWDSERAARQGILRWQNALPSHVHIEQNLLDDFNLLRGLGIQPAHAIRLKGTASIKDLLALRQRLSDEICALGGEIIELDRDLEDTRDVGDGPLLVAAGIGSRALLERWGLQVPMISERGYHLDIDQHMPSAGKGPIVFEDRSFILTPLRHGVRIASFVEFGDQYSAPDPSKWKRLKQMAQSVGFDASDGKLWHGSRPTLPDYLPAIGKAGKLEDHFYAFGHQHLGLTLGSITGEIVAAMIDGEEGWDLAPLSLERFQTF